RRAARPGTTRPLARPKPAQNRATRPYDYESSNIFFGTAGFGAKKRPKLGLQRRNKMRWCAPAFFQNLESLGKMGKIVPSEIYILKIDLSERVPKQAAVAWDQSA